MGREESFTISTLNDFNGSLADLSIVNNCVKDTEQEHEWLFVSKPDRYVKIYQSSGHIMIHQGGVFLLLLNTFTQFLYDFTAISAFFTRNFAVFCLKKHSIITSSLNG